MVILINFTGLSLNVLNVDNKTRDPSGEEKSIFCNGELDKLFSKIEMNEFLLFPIKWREKFGDGVRKIVYYDGTRVRNLNWSDDSNNPYNIKKRIK